MSSGFTRPAGSAVWRTKCERDLCDSQGRLEEEVVGLPGWLFRVAHNLVLRRRYRTRLDFEMRTEATTKRPAIDPGPSPEELVLNTPIRKRLLAVASVLPEQDRRCLFLRAEGVRYREIAEIPGMSLGAVSLSLARSLTRIARSAER